MNSYDFVEYQFGRDVVTDSKSHTCSIMYDLDGHPIVVISDIIFKGKRNIDWESVEEYVKSYVGSNYEIIESSDKVFIGNSLPNEIKGSEDTKRLRGAQAKAKANATTQIPMLLRTASNKRWQENFKSKHKKRNRHPALALAVR